MTSLARVPLLAVLLLPQGTQDPEDRRLRIDGNAYDAAGIAKLESEAQRRLAALEKQTQPNEPLKAAVQAEISALASARGLAEKLERVDRRAPRDAALEQAKADLAEVRKNLEKPAAPASVSDEEMERFLAAEEHARRTHRAEERELQQREAELAELTKGIDARTAEIARLQRERASLTAALTDEPDRRLELAQRLRVNTIQVWIHETWRDANRELTQLAEQARDLARARAELSQARAALALANLEAARKVKERELAAEKERARAEADRKRRVSERTASPAARAVARIESLAADYTAREREEAVTESRLQGALREASQLRDRAREQLERLRKQLPAGTQLDGMKRSYLIEQRTRVRRRLADYGQWRRRIEAFLAGAQSRSMPDRDRVGALHYRILEAPYRAARDTLSARLLDETGIVTGEDQETWVAALTDFEAARNATADAEARARVRREWDAAVVRLRAIVQKRLERFENIERLSGEALLAAGELGRLLREQARYLRELSFWLRESPLFAAAELSAAGRELERLAGAFPQRLASAWRSITQRGGWPWDLLIVVVLTLASAVGLHRFQRTRVAGEAEARRRATARRALARFGPPALLGIGAAVVAFGLLPGEPIVYLGFLIVASGIAFHVGLTSIRVWLDGDDPTRRLARRLARIGVAALCLLLPAILFLDRIGHVRLAELAKLALAWIGFGLAVVLLFKRDVLLLLVPAEGSGPLALSLRRAIAFFWPAFVLFYAVVLVLNLLGYRNASGPLALRLLLCVGVLVSVNLVHRSLKRLIRFLTTESPGDDDEDADTEPDEEASAWRDLIARTLGLTLIVATAISTAVLLSLVLGISADGWDAFFGTEIVPGRPGETGTTAGGLAKGVLIIAGGFVLGRLIADLLAIVLRRSRRLSPGSRYAVSTLAFYSLIAIGVFLGLRALGIYVSELAWLLAPAGVAIGFGLQEVFSNFVCGLILFLERPVQVGDVISVGEIEGDVQSISIRSTKVRTRDGISIIIPNKRLIVDDVINWSHGDARTRLRAEVGVAYGSDVPLVKRTLLEVARQDARVLRRPKPEVQFKAFGESALQFALLVWVDSPDITMRRRLLSDLYSAIDAAFAKFGITVPFPQRDLHLKTTPRDHRRRPEADYPERAPESGDQTPATRAT